MRDNAIKYILLFVHVAFDFFDGDARDSTLQALLLLISLRLPLFFLE